ncbi:MAG: hypothetical protein H7144_17535 [Burkholderiales bacterium]|nr:hypothetical protein [Phycisphaerae bacterium]
MVSALRRLGVFLFCLGAIAVVTALVPVGLAVVDEKKEQAWLAIAMVGGLLVVSGLVMDWLGTQVIRESPAAVLQPDSRPPTMRISSKPAGPKGYREDLMA